MESAARFFLYILFVTGLFATELNAQQTIRIVTYNVRNCRGLDNYNQVNTNRVANIISKTNADIVGLEELDCKTARVANRDILTELAQQTRLESAYAPAIHLGSGQYGVGALFKFKPIKTYAVALPGKEEKRVLLVCQFEQFVLFVTHLSLTAESRTESVQIINAEADKFTLPVILVGDFNDSPDSIIIQQLQRSWKQVSSNEPTFPANKPTETIDYIFVKTTQTVTVVQSTVLDEPTASDHRPVFAEIRVE